LDRKVSHFKIGLFILICSGLIVGVVTWLGLSNYFEETKTYVTFLDESVKGLQEDAVINYRGIVVGRVAAIELAPDGRLIRILMALRSDFDVADYMAVQLREQGLTGLRHLEIDTAPENLDMLTPELSFPIQDPLIPSIPSEFAQLKTALETLYGKIMALDAKAAFNSLQRTLAAVTEAAQSSAALMKQLAGFAEKEELQENLQRIGAVLTSTRDVADTLDRQLSRIPPGALADLVSRLTDIVARTQNLVATLDQQVTESSVLMRRSLQKFNQLAVQLTTLAETIQQKPSRLLIPSEKVDPFDR
jgi:phospholipid/cholesterol/gamma-HCH transport system substrate-binding protein